MCGGRGAATKHGENLVTRRDSSHDMFREALCGEGVSQRRCPWKGASGTGRRGGGNVPSTAPQGGAASGLHKPGSPCRLEGPGLAGPEAAGTDNTPFTGKDAWPGLRVQTHKGQSLLSTDTDQI